MQEAFGACGTILPLYIRTHNVLRLLIKPFMPQSIWTPLGQLAHMISSPELSIQLDAVHSLIRVLDPILRIRLQFRTFETCATVIQSLLLYLATHMWF